VEGWGGKEGSQDYCGKYGLDDLLGTDPAA